MTEKKNVYITMHKSFVREGIEYQDRETGEVRTFNSVTLPKGTMVDGQDMGRCQFSPLYVNPSKFRGENYRDIPLLADREVWLSRTVLDGEGNPQVSDDGKQVRETFKVMPQAIKQGLDEGRKQYLESLDDKAKGAKEAAKNQEHEAREAECAVR